MPKNFQNLDSPVFTIKLQKGLADRKRLPLSDVLTILEEVRQMIADVGREMQRDRGMERPTGDFGLELLAGTNGILFKPGSVQAQVAITTHIEIGTSATQRVVSTIDALSRKRPIIVTEADRSVIRRLNRIYRITDRDKTELQLVLERPGRYKPIQATFDANAAATAWSLQAPVFEMEAITIFGKLHELKDTDPDDDTGTKGFWGELRIGSGEIWRIQFNADQMDEATRLFRKQVAITGIAKYYRVAAPKLIAAKISADQERDYERAFYELYGCDKQIYGNDFNKALKEMRGED